MTDEARQSLSYGPARDSRIAVSHTRDYETSNMKGSSPLFTELRRMFQVPAIVKRVLSAKATLMPLTIV